MRVSMPLSSSAVSAKAGRSEADAAVQDTIGSGWVDALRGRILSGDLVELTYEWTAFEDGMEDNTTHFPTLLRINNGCPIATPGAVVVLTIVARLRVSWAAASMERGVHEISDAALLPAPCAPLLLRRLPRRLQLLALFFGQLFGQVSQPIFLFFVLVLVRNIRTV